MIEAKIDQAIEEARKAMYRSEISGYPPYCEFVKVYLLPALAECGLELKEKDNSDLRSVCGNS